MLMKNWNDTIYYFNEITIYSQNISKFELLNIIKKIFNKDIKINPKDLGKNKSLSGTIYTKGIESQLIELKKFYYGS